MTDFLSCAAIEQGGYWMAGLVIFAIVIVVALEVLFIRLFVAILRDPSSKVKLQVGEKLLLNIGGKVTGLVVLLLALVLVLLPPGVAWYLFHNFADYYSVAVDAEGTDTLESIRATLAHEPRTHVAVFIASNLKTFPVHGEFQGVCVADLFDAICRAHADKLRCERDYTKRTVTVRSR